MLARLVRKPLTWIVVAVLAAGGAFGLYWFQPWKIFTTKVVNESVPEVVTANPGPEPDRSATPGSPATPNRSATPEAGKPPPAAPRNTLLATGRLITHEHDTSGEVQLVRLADGRTQVVLRNLRTSDGPDVRVWLTDQAVDPADWHNFDDGRYVELGPIKGNVGNQVYLVPSGTDLSGLRSVSLWCKRFSVSFGAAELRAV